MVLLHAPFFTPQCPCLFISLENHRSPLFFEIRNYLFSPDRLPGVIGITRHDHKGNNVLLDEDKKSIITAIDQRLQSADYAIISSHDYREVVPEHMKMTIEYLNANYNIEYVTIGCIGEMVRNGEIRNNW